MLNLAVIKTRVKMTSMALMAMAMVAGGSAAFQATSAPTCKPAGSLMRLAGLPEASGLVASRATPGRLWAHNDSGTPEIFALDAKGKVAGRVAVSGASLQDWEAMASGACGKGTCLYVADIGDNSGKRQDVTVYRIPEPSATGGSVKVDGIFVASYPDGGHDAEALLAASDGRLYIVTKGDTGDVSLYRFPSELRTGMTMRLERVGSALSKGQPAANARITDGAISADGEWVALRTKTALIFYRAAQFLSGEFKEAGRMDLTSLGEPQGEAVAFGPSNTLYIAGEGGGKSQPGTLATLSCTK